MTTNAIPLTKFVFHVHKPKAAMLAKLMVKASRHALYDLKVTEDHHPVADRVGIFYGVVPETYAAFRYYMAEGRALYLDNGWLSTREYPTFRFSWNSVQPFLQDMPEAPKSALAKFGELPKIQRQPQRDLALLVLQSRQYFDNLRLGYSRDVWVRATTRMLELKGYRVETREKPSKKDPEAETFFDQMARAGIVVSLNSAACLKALRYGIPAYCLLDCTLSPYAPVKLPDCGMAGAAPKEGVEELCRKLASYEITKDQIANGQAIAAMLGVRKEMRRGYWYGTR